MKQPESPARRKAIRNANKGLGNHWDIKRFIDRFNHPPEDNDELYHEWLEAITKTLQTICDYIHDVSQSKIGGANLAITSLIFSCIDELLVYVELCKYRYYTQANAHLRTVYESTELIALFHKFPELLDHWFSDDWKVRDQNFSPRNVRLKLGKPKFDQVYKFLCEHGTHATSEAFSHRTMKGASPGFENVAYISIGGTKRHDVRLQCCVFGIVVGNLVIKQFLDVFPDKLNADEVEQDLGSLMTITSFFFNKHFVSWAKAENLDAEELEVELAQIFD